MTLNIDPKKVDNYKNKHRFIFRNTLSICVYECVKCIHTYIP